MFGIHILFAFRSCDKLDTHVYKETSDAWINIHILQKEENKRHLAFTRIIKN